MRIIDDFKNNNFKLWNYELKVVRFGAILSRVFMLVFFRFAGQIRKDRCTGTEF